MTKRVHGQENSDEDTSDNGERNIAVPKIGALGGSLLFDYRLSDAKTLLKLAANRAGKRNNLR